VPGAGSAGTEVVLERLIERRLSLAEVNRYGPPEPEQVLVERRVAEVRARFASWEALEAVLTETGITLEQLAQHVRDDLRLEAYIQQRFGGTVQPTEAEILQYYRDHQDAFTRGGTVVPFRDAHADARAALVEERRAAAVREWVAGLRRRSNVTIPGIVPVK
jgi:hypothetical protein